MSVPPPPFAIPRLPHLTGEQRQAETAFADAYLEDPGKMVAKYLKKLRKGKIGVAPNVFATDDAKLLDPHYNPKGADLETLHRSQATYNVAVHQTANAIAKKAFLSYLDTTVSKLPPDKRSVLVTQGGVAAGKGSSLSRAEDPDDPHHGMLPAADMVGAVWDAAGEQNSTENPWVLEECKKRGIHMICAYVHADPDETWDSPTRGVLRRARRKGRMVDALLFAESYRLGGPIMKAFVDQHQDDPAVSFIFLDNRDKKQPRLLNHFPDEALTWDGPTIYRRAIAALKQRRHELDPALYRGGMVGTEMWMGGDDE